MIVIEKEFKNYFGKDCITIKSDNNKYVVDEDGNKFESADILKENFDKFTESVEDIKNEDEEQGE